MAQEPITARPGGNIHEIASTVIASQMGTKYDNGEFNITDGTEDYDVSGESDLFNNITKAHVVSIRCTGTISVKFNSTSNDSITIRKADSPARFSTLEISSIYVTNNSGATVTVYIFMI